MPQFCNIMVVVAQPKVRPFESVWPAEEHSRHLTLEELAELNPELRAALSPDRATRPFSITLVFPRLDVAQFPRALDLARQSPDFGETGTGRQTRYRATFFVADAARLREVFDVVGRSADTEILVDGQPLPYGRELWIPLVGFFINP